MKKLKGYSIIILLELITLLLWFTSKANIIQITQSPLLSISQAFGLSGIILMSLNLIMTTRFRFIEELFAGLDKVYQVHQLLGALAFVFIVSHPLFQVFQALPDTQLARFYLFPSTDISYNLGIFALYSFLLAMVFIVFIKLPYHIWKFTHKFMALTFLLASIHSTIIGSDISRSAPLKIWVIIWIAAGIISALYIIFLYGNFGPRYPYRIKDVASLPSITNLYLEPVKKILPFIPGQFIYLSTNNLKVGKELHPFSISSSADKKMIRLSAKIVGDYTRRLHNLPVGDEVLLYGPYGKFGRILANEKIKTHIMVAGGIGITPFLSMLSTLSRYKKNKKFRLFYSFKNSNDAVFSKELTEIVKENPSVEVVFWNSTKRGRLNVKNIFQGTQISEQVSIQICGPKKMMDSLKAKLLKLGLKNSQVITEDFNFL